MRGAVISVVLLSFLLGINSASAAIWSEVARFTPYWGTAPNVLRETWAGSFTCNQSEWRIVWNYTPLSIVAPENVYFNILIYRANDTVYYMTEMSQQGNTTTSGTWYINNETGGFYLKFLVYNVLNATTVIQQAHMLVSTEDVVRVATAFGSRLGDPNWDSWADFDYNGVVNISDVGFIASRLGQTI